MVEKDHSISSSEPRVKQQPSVPFLWEEKPGTPKKNWKPETVSVNYANTVPPPVNLVISVPFKWEENPATPLPYFSQPQKESPVLPPPPTKFISFPSLSVYSLNSSPSTISGNHVNVFKRCFDTSDSSEDEEEGNEEIMGRQEMLELEFDAINFKIDRSFESAPSLLANRLLPARAISGAVPINQYSVITSSTTKTVHVGYEAPGSQAFDTDSEASSYATGNSSLVGSSFLECFFPLFSPDPSFLDRVQFHEKSPYLNPLDPDRELRFESNYNRMVRRTPTLGELIRMSRRTNNGKSSINARRKNPPMDFVKKRLLGCFGSGGRTMQRRLNGRD